MPSLQLIAIDVGLEHMAQVAFVRLLHHRINPSPVSIQSPLEESIVRGKLSSTSFTTERLHKFLGFFFLKGRFPSSPTFIILSVIYIHLFH